MKRFLIIVFCLASIHLNAQHVSRDFRDVSLSDALKYIQTKTSEYSIVFIYDDLEDFRVTTSISRKTVPDAIQQLIGFYPIRMTVKQDEHEIYVECIHKTARHLTGTICDEKGRPMAYANVAVLDAADSTLINSGVSNESGYFIIPYEPQEVVARISHIGYKTILKQCSKPEMGMIRMQPDNYLLKGVTVNGQTPVMRKEAGIIYFDTRHIAGAINAKDLLHYTPGVTVVDDQISLFGASEILLCINGKEQRMPVGEMLQMLQTYPATNVTRIEVVPNPGAGYSSEGRAGVVNIVLKKQNAGFFGGTVAYARTQYEKQGDEANAGFIYNHGKWSASLNLAATNDQILYRETNTIDFDDTRRKHTDDGLICKENYAFRGHADFQASANLYLGAYVMYADGERRLGIDGLYDFLPKNPYTVSKYETLSHREEATKTWAVNMNAAQKLGDSGAKIDCNLDYFRLRMGDRRQSENHATFTGKSLDEEVRIDTVEFYYQNKIAQTIDNYSAKVDVGYAGFQFGSQYIYTRSHLDLEYTENYYCENATTSYDEQIWSAYVEYDRVLGKAWSVNIGGRYEHTWTKGENSIGRKDFRSNGGNIFPSLNVGFHPGNGHAVNCSFSSRLTRPNIINLNPNRVWKDVNHVSYGNQNLKPFHLYKAMMGYTYKGALSVDLYYSYQPDRVDPVYYVDKFVTYSSWDNTTDEQSLGLKAICNFDKWPWMKATLMQELRYSKTTRSPKNNDAGSLRTILFPQVENCSYAGMLQMSFFFDKNHKWAANLHATCHSREKDVAQKLDARYMVDAGLRGRFIKDRLTVNITCRNLLASPLKGEEYLGTTVMDFNNKFDYRQLHLTLTYNWGVPLKHKKRHYESDEMQERIVNDF